MTRLQNSLSAWKPENVSLSDMAAKASFMSSDELSMFFEEQKTGFQISYKKWLLKDIFPNNVYYFEILFYLMALFSFFRFILLFLYFLEKF